MGAIMAKQKKIRRNPIDNWICSECGKAFTSIHGLQYHIGRIHGAPYTLVDRENMRGTPSWGDDD